MKTANNLLRQKLIIRPLTRVTLDDKNCKKSCTPFESYEEKELV